MKRFLAFALLVLLCSLSLHAQSVVPTPDPLADAWHVQLSGGYSLTTNEGTNNGFASSIALRLGHHWNGRADVFSVNSPATIVTLIGPEFRWSLAQWVTPNQFIDTTRFVPFVNVGFGAAKNSNDVGKFAWSAGGGFDVKVDDTFYLRPLDVRYVRASIFQGGGIWIGNHMRLAAGFGLHF